MFALPEGGRFGYRWPMNSSDKASQRIVKFTFLAALHDPATRAAIRALGMRPAGD